jgi:hypothetical protein
MSVKWSEQDLKEARTLFEGIKECSIQTRKEAKEYKNTSYKLYIALRNLCFISVCMTVTMLAFQTRFSLISLALFSFNLGSLCLFAIHEIGGYFDKWRRTVSKEFKLEQLASAVNNEINNPSIDWGSYSNSVSEMRNQILQTKI